MSTSRSRFLSVLFITAFFGSSAWATQYFISPTGDDTTGNGTTGTPYKTLDKCWAVGATGGDTVILKSGTYNYAGMEFDSGIPSGSAGSYVDIKAETDGGAIITLNNALSMQTAATPLQQYILVEGLKFDGAYQKNIYGLNLKFLRCSFKGGPSSGNTVNTAVGGNDNGTNLARYILLEDCWFYGGGGRYKLLVFNAENIILRRVVIRDDAGWNDSPNTGNPEACFALYNSSACEVQDMVLLDSTSSGYYEYGQAFYFIHNPGAVPDHVVIGNNINGLLVLNTKAICVRADAATSSGNVFNDLILADCENGGISWGSNDNTAATLNRYGVIHVNITQTGDFQGGAAWFGSGGAGITATNGIVASMAGTDLQGLGVTPTFFDSYNNGGTNYTGATGRITSNPNSNGWLYPVRIETGSTLATAGSAGGQMGPKMTTEIGVSGTLWGEAGYNTDTGVSLWPWRNEARIKTDFSEVTAPVGTWTRGSDRLTEYIFKYFGNAMPSGIYTSATGTSGSGFRILGDTMH